VTVLLFVAGVFVAIVVVWGLLSWLRFIGPSEPKRRCPECAESIRAEARVCRYCGARLVTAEADRKSAAAEKGSQR
jgi:predicted amidophosphoribosyltransferase